MFYNLLEDVKFYKEHGTVYMTPERTKGSFRHIAFPTLYIRPNQYREDTIMIKKAYVMTGSITEPLICLIDQEVKLEFTDQWYHKFIMLDYNVTISLAYDKLLGIVKLTSDNPAYSFVIEEISVKKDYSLKLPYENSSFNTNDIGKLSITGLTYSSPVDNKEIFTKIKPMEINRPNNNFGFLLKVIDSYDEFDMPLYGYIGGSISVSLGASITISSTNRRITEVFIEREG